MDGMRTREECRQCGQDVMLRADETLRSHRNPDGKTCPGSHTPGRDTYNEFVQVVDDKKIGQCPQCKEWFTRTPSPGAKRVYCSDGCKSAAAARRSSTPPRRAYQPRLPPVDDPEFPHGTLRGYFAEAKRLGGPNVCDACRIPGRAYFRAKRKEKS